MPATFTITGNNVGGHGARSVYVQYTTQVANPTENLNYDRALRFEALDGVFTLDGLAAWDPLNLPYDAGSAQHGFIVSYAGKKWTVPAQPDGTTVDVADFTDAWAAPTTASQYLQVMAALDDANAAASDAAASAAAAAAVGSTNDTIIAGRINDTTPSATRAALNAAYASTAASRERGLWSNGPQDSHIRTLTLIGGQADESPSTAGSGTPSVAVDTTNFKVGSRGWALTMGGAGTGQFYVTPTATVVPATPVSAVGMWVYIPSLTGLTQVTVNISSGANTWTGTLYAASTPAMAAGWNYIRFAASDSTISGLTGINQVRLLVVATAATTVTIGHLWLEMRPKASLIVAFDGAYGSSMVNALPITAPGYSLSASGYGGYLDLKARGIPVVFAPDTGKMGLNTGLNAPPVDRASWVDMARVMADGNGNEMNYHGSTGNPTSAMTAVQYQAECMAAIKALQASGYPAPLIKAAITQNSAAHPEGAAGLHLGTRSYSNGNGTPAIAWPPSDITNIPCYAINYGITNAAMDTAFATLLATNQVMFCYFHGVDPAAGSANGFALPATWAYFLSKVDAAVAAGQLEGVTLNQLLARDGVKVRRTVGDQQVEYFDAAGTRQQKRLP